MHSGSVPSTELFICTFRTQFTQVFQSRVFTRMEEVFFINIFSTELYRWVFVVNMLYWQACPSKLSQKIHFNSFTWYMRIVLRHDTPIQPRPDGNLQFSCCSFSSTKYSLNWIIISTAMLGVFKDPVTRKRIQWIKYLLWKHKGLSLNLRHPHKKNQSHVQWTLVPECEKIKLMLRKEAYSLLAGFQSTKRCQGGCRG